MRCVNCGYDNSKDRTACLKCGQPLRAIPSSDRPSGNIPKPTVLGANMANLTESTERKTVIMNLGSNGVQSPSPVISETPSACPSCDYPVIGNYENCPSCGVSLKNNPVKDMKTVLPDLQKMMDNKFVCQHCQQEISMTNAFCPHCGQRVHLPTILPSKKGAKKELPSCSLTIVPEENETIAITKKDYEGTSIVLNRFNTEETNRTITTQEQAVLTNEDGDWYIENRSIYQTTYLMLNRKIKLEEGDIIILGDRKFKFEKD